MWKYNKQLQWIDRILIIMSRGLYCEIFSGSVRVYPRDLDMGVAFRRWIGSESPQLNLSKQTVLSSLVFVVVSRQHVAHRHHHHGPGQPDIR